jgi:hypothetical protein
MAESMVWKMVELKVVLKGSKLVDLKVLKTVDHLAAPKEPLKVAPRVVKTVEQMGDL